MTKPILALFGGAFNPFTTGHRCVINNLLYVAEKVLVVPARYHRGKNGMVPYDHRLAMAGEALLDCSDKVAVLDIDPDQDCPPESFGSTWNLAREVQKRYPEYAVHIVVGADNALTIDSWYNSKALLESFPFLCVNRDASLKELPYGMRGQFISMNFPASSTEARKCLYAKDYAGAEAFLSDRVISYIRMNDLYRLVTGGPDLLADGSNYDRNAYPKAANTVDTAIVRRVSNHLEVLLVKRKWEPCKGQWALPGGFVDISKGESLAAAAQRELEEETGVKGIPVTQLGTYGDPDRDPRDRVISTVYYALLPTNVSDSLPVMASDDAMDYQWRKMDSGEEYPDLAFDHARILKDLGARLHKDALYTTLPLCFVSWPMFTWAQVSDAYEAMLGRRVSNIRRKLLSRYDIRETGEKETGVRHRQRALLKWYGEKNSL